MSDEQLKGDTYWSVEITSTPQRTANLTTMNLQRRVCSVINRPLLLTCFVLVCCGALYVICGYQTHVKVPQYVLIDRWSMVQLRASKDTFDSGHQNHTLERGVHDYPSTPARESTNEGSISSKDSITTHVTISSEPTSSIKGFPAVWPVNWTGEDPPMTSSRGHIPHETLQSDDGNVKYNASAGLLLTTDRTISSRTTKNDSGIAARNSRDEDISQRMVRRKNILEYTCDKHKLEIGQNFLYKDTYRHMYVIDSEKLLFCYIPKVGCSNWKRILMVLDGKRNETDDITSREAHAHNGMTVLGKVSREGQQYRLQNYRKVMFVREPLARVVSAYKNKFADSGVYRTAPRVFHSFGKKIVAKYRTDPTPLELSTGENVTWTEFVKYLTDEEERAGFDRHWKEMYKLCSPCQIQYDFIGKLEHVDEEAEYVLRKLNLTRPVRFPGRENSHPTNVSTSTFQYFDNFSQETLSDLWNIYRTDYELFGFKKPYYIK